MRKLHETEWDGPRRADCKDCTWSLSTSSATGKTAVINAARLHASTAGHRINVATLHVLQVVPLVYRAGKWTGDRRREHRASVERAGNRAGQRRTVTTAVRTNTSAVRTNKTGGHA